MPQPSDQFDVIAAAHAERDVFSTAASELSRKLCFVGYALIALFGGLDGQSVTFPLDLPNRLVWAGLLITVALMLDLLQYVYGAIVFAVLGRLEEVARAHEQAGKGRRTGKRRKDFPRQINWPTNVFFIGKLLLTIAAWILLLVHLSYNVKFR